MVGKAQSYMGGGGVKYFNVLTAKIFSQRKDEPTHKKTSRHVEFNCTGSFFT